ncbi:MAG: hypothetical protein NT166_02490 [Candidatus Aminicenantes bacterium]|nr:hypothetical protein [Candidatus Aminicenantes bacterium]
MELNKQPTLSLAAEKASLNMKTARKYRDLGKLPSQLSIAEPRSYRTRPDPFVSVWPKAKSLLKVNPGLQAKSLYAYFQLQIISFSDIICNWVFKFVFKVTNE